MNENIIVSIDFISQLKQQILSSRYIVAKIVNTELIGSSVTNQLNESTTYDLVKQPHENPSISIILYKEKDDKRVEYSFRYFSKPIGVSTFKTTENLPVQYRKALQDTETLKKLLD